MTAQSTTVKSSSHLDPIPADATLAEDRLSLLASESNTAVGVPTVMIPDQKALPALDWYRWLQG